VKLEELKKDWDALGRIDPLWAVLTHEDRRNRAWDEEAFLANGREEIAGVMRDLERLGRPARRGRCLDFGCGVGRLTQALAEHFARCDGVDIAPSMLETARRLNRHGDRVAYRLNDTDDLALFPSGSFDFVYSNIVLQHVGPEAAKAYIREFVRLLAPGGLALFQVPSENIRAELQQEHRLPEEAFRARIAATVPDEAEPGRSLTLAAIVTNESRLPWPADPPTDGTCRIRLGNHWLTAAGRAVSFDDGRAALPKTLDPGESVAIPLEVTAPSLPGRYVLVLDLVQEDIAWFEGKGSPTFRAPVRVRGGLAARGRALFGRSGAAGGPAVTDATDTALTLRAGADAPVMRMTGVPRDEVLATVDAAGGCAVAVLADPSSGREWRSFRYAVTRRE
jgi:2-polyprenyl-3-methyl-5-hydroxy-6-metoxy-1,4-benzoquinol methylase